MNISGGPHYLGTPRRRRTRNRLGSACARHLKHALLAGRVSGLSTTPLSPWKINDSDAALHPEVGRRRRGRRAGVGSVSSRMLAASLWQLHPADGGEGRCLQCGPRDHSGSQVEHSLPHPKSGMEGATKWDPRCSKASNEAYWSYGHKKFLGDQQVSTVSIVSSLQGELFQARMQVHELEAEQRSSKKEVDHLLRKLEEEKSLWQRREREKFRVVIDDLKDELCRERKNCRRVEKINSRLVTELANAKVWAKKFMQDYEKEKKARELMEDISNELAKEIGEDRAEMVVWKSEMLKFHEELEEERKMLQMAEVWREERIHMKLVDAKLALEDKYCQMNKLITDLETFLQTRSEALGAMELRKAELISQAVRSVNIKDINEFSYVPSESNDIFSIIEELRQGGTGQRGIEHDDCSPASHVSEFHTVNLETDRVDKNHMPKHSTLGNTPYIDLDGASGLETVTHVEGLASYISLGDNESSVNNAFRDRSSSRRETVNWDGHLDQDPPETENSEVCLVSAAQSRQKVSSTSNHWKSCPNECNGRISNGEISSVENAASNERFGEGGLKHRDAEGQWSLLESGNPQITQGMKGCIEWPHGIQKHSLKARLLEARMESEKSQLRDILKPKT